MKQSRALWGIILIFIGLFWILKSFDWVSMDLFGSLRTLWPVFIIAGGLTFFFKRESYLPRVILWLLVFVLIGGYAIYLGSQDVMGTESSKTFTMRSDIQSASLLVEVSGANLDVGSGSELAVVDTNIESIQYEYDEGSNPRILYRQNNSLLGWNSKQGFKARLNRDIPWTIEVNTGTTKGTLDLSDIELNQCTINTGSCDLDILAGNKSREARITINGGAVNLKITLPEDVGLRVSSSSAVTRINGQVDLLEQDSVYHSDNFDSAPNKLYLDMACGAGSITVNR